MSFTEAPSSPRPEPLKDIPSPVYHFLFKIALENYEPDRVQDWYSAMLSHVRQAHTQGIQDYLHRPSMQSTPPPRPARAPIKTWTLALRDPDDPTDPGEGNSVSDLVRVARELPGRATNTTPNPAQDETWALTSATSSPMPCSTPAFQSIPDFTASTLPDSVPINDQPSLMPPSATSSLFISPRTPVTSSDVWFSSTFPDASTYSTTAAPTFDNVFLQQDPSNAFVGFANSFYNTTPSTTAFDFLANQTNIGGGISSKDFMMPLPPTTQPQLHAITTTSPNQAITQTSPMSSTSSMLGFREIRPATERSMQNFNNVTLASSTGSPRKRPRESVDGETAGWEATQRSRKHQSM